MADRNNEYNPDYDYDYDQDMYDWEGDPYWNRGFRNYNPNWDRGNRESRGRNWNRGRERYMNRGYSSNQVYYRPDWQNNPYWNDRNRSTPPNWNRGYRSSRNWNQPINRNRNFRSYYEDENLEGYGQPNTYYEDYPYDYDLDFYDIDDYDNEPAYTVTEYWWFVPGPFQGIGPQGYQRSDDRICEDICERLTQHGQLDARDIDIDVDNSVVTIKGNVSSRREKRLAEDIVDSVSGVTDVHNQLKVEKKPQNKQRKEQLRPGQKETKEKSRRTQ